MRHYNYEYRPDRFRTTSVWHHRQRTHHFPCLIIGLILYLAVLEALWLRTKRDVYRRQYDFWLKPFAASFMFGAATGIVLSYQLDTIFQAFYEQTANVLLSIRRIEFANALLVESGAFGIMLFGRRRVGERLHFAATLVMAIAVLVSGVCIMARNAWMQTPAGFIVVDNELRVDDWFSVVFNPSFPYRFVHMLGAACEGGVTKAGSHLETCAGSYCTASTRYLTRWRMTLKRHGADLRACAHAGSEPPGYPIISG